MSGADIPDSRSTSDHRERDHRPNPIRVALREQFANMSTAAAEVQAGIHKPGFRVIPSDRCHHIVLLTIRIRVFT